MPYIVKIKKNGTSRPIERYIYNAKKRKSAPTLSELIEVRLRNFDITFSQENRQLCQTAKLSDTATFHLHANYQVAIAESQGRIQPILYFNEIF